MMVCLKHPHPKSGDQPLPSWGLWFAASLTKWSFGYHREVETERPLRLVRHDLALGPIGVRFVRLTKAS